jgi:hypothetical protein
LRGGPALSIGSFELYVTVCDEGVGGKREKRNAILEIKHELPAVDC